MTIRVNPPGTRGARVPILLVKLIGDVVQYEDAYRLAYIRGPEGVIVGLSEQIG